jgi:DNA topoisomerase-1
MSDELDALLEQADLRYISTDIPGFQRKRWGRGFTYLDREGETIRDDALRAWIECIAIPPAWEDVWISPYKNAHILATGRDAKGRKQYRYHPRWQELRNQNKFDDLVRFGTCLPHIREVTDSHLRKRTLNRQRVLALVVRLLETTLIRIGNNEYAQGNETYGLTTLEDDHVQINGSKLTFQFVGKSGIDQTVNLRDPRLARLVRACRDIPGYELFQYQDEHGNYQAIDSSDVNAYLNEITGEPFTAKVFRTWGASTMVVGVLSRLEAESDTDDREQQVKEAVKQVACELGNTVAVCRNYYIHPAIGETYISDGLHTVLSKQPVPQSPYDLKPEEAALVEIIKNKS